MKPGVSSLFHAGDGLSVSIELDVEYSTIPIKPMCVSFAIGLLEVDRAGSIEVPLKIA